MGAPHGHPLHYHAHSPLHRAPAHLKIVVLVAFMLVVVATPRSIFWPYAVHAALLLIAWAVSRVPARHVLPRMLIEVPFVVFALLLPFVATGERVEMLGLGLSRPGLEGAAMLLAKGTLGVLAAILLASTTEARDLIVGLRTLRVPVALVQILSFMLRYLEVIGDQWSRMTLARRSRGFRAGSPRAWPTLATALGTLFIRSYERGERVHLAMMARGYDVGTPDAGG